MNRLIVVLGILCLTTSCDITDYFMDESGVVKHKDGTTVEQSEIDRESNSRALRSGADLLKRL